MDRGNGEKHKTYTNNRSKVGNKNTPQLFTLDRIDLGVVRNVLPFNIGTEVP